MYYRSLLLVLSAGLAFFPIVYPSRITRAAPREEHEGAEKPDDRLPEGAVARLGDSRQSTDHIQSLAFSPDGRTLAAGNLWGNLQLWDVATGRCLRFFALPEAVPNAPPTGSVDALAFSADGKTLITGTRDRKVRIWDAATGKLLRTVAEQEGVTRRFALSPDGRTLATAGKVGEAVRLWDTATGTGIRALQGEKVADLAFSPDGKKLAGGNAKAIRVWDVSTGKVLLDLKGHMDWVLTVAFSPDGKALVSGGVDGTVRFWDPATGDCLRTLEGHQGWVASLVFAPDGSFLCSASCNRLDDLEPHREVRGDRGEPPPPPRREQALTDYPIHFWDVSSKRPPRLGVGHANEVRAVAVAPDGRVVASASSDETLRLWEVATGQELYRLGAHSQSVRALRFAPDGQTLTAAGADGTFREWEAATGRELRFWRGRDDAHITFSLDGRLFASGGYRRQEKGNLVNLGRLDTGKELFELTGHNNTVAGLAFSPDGKTLATGCRGDITFWDTATGQSSATIKGHQDLITALVYSPDGKTLASAGWDKTLRLWDVDTRKQRGEGQRIDRPFEALVFSPDGKLLASSSTGNDVLLWDAATGKPTGKLEGHTNGVSVLAFSPDGKLLASGGGDRVVRVWDVAQKKETRKFSGFTGTVHALAFAPDGKVLASVSESGELFAWKLEGHSLRPLPPVRLTPKEVETLWADLALEDACRARHVIGLLTADPARAVPALQKRLCADAGETVQLRQRIADLDSNEFAIREAASKELEKAGGSAEQLLRRALADKPSLEMRKRLEVLLNRLEQTPVRLSAEEIRQLRSVWVLEQIGSAEARGLLEDLANGEPEARITRDAKAALRRMARRTSEP
jgi:WD40 repeat protein